MGTMVGGESGNYELHTADCLFFTEEDAMFMNLREGHPHVET